MAKGLRSKVHRRYRSVKRQRVEDTIEASRVLEAHKKLCAIQSGTHCENMRAPNKFLYPDNEAAEIPRVKITEHLDFRSEALPLSGFAGVGQRRKFTQEEKERLKAAYGHVPGPTYEESSLMNKFQLGHEMSGFSELSSWDNSGITINDTVQFFPFAAPPSFLIDASSQLEGGAPDLAADDTMSGTTRLAVATCKITPKAPRQKWKKKGVKSNSNQLLPVSNLKRPRRPVRPQEKF